MELLFYNPAKIKNTVGGKTDPPMRRFYELFKFVNNSVLFLDRTGTIISPFRSKNLFPLGDNSKSFGRSFSEIMLIRAKELLDLSERRQKPIALFWSGGIDSTAILVAMKILEPNPATLRERIHLILSPESICEYPAFYTKHVRGQFKMLPSHDFSEYFLGQYIVVNGEGNDQLFGSQLISQLPPTLGTDFLWHPADEESIRTFLTSFELADCNHEQTADLFLRLNKTCPSGVESFFEFLWWMNFTCKWQSVFIRMLGYLQPAARAHINADFIEQNYHCFFMTPEFENWSIWNKHLKIKDSLESYKGEAKEFIFRFAGDKDYLDNKLKVGSLSLILRHQSCAVAINDSWQFLEKFPFDEVYEPNHSFR